MSQTYHILIADDDEDDQDLIKSSINQCHLDNLLLTAVYNGVELLECLNRVHQHTEKPPVDLIFLDINMPVMDGLTVLKKIKSDDRFKKIPVFIVSTLRTIDKVENFFDAGAANVYSKPNSMSGYKKIVEEIFATTYYLKNSKAGKG